MDQVKNRFALLLSLLLCGALVALAAPADGTWNAANPSQGAPLVLVLQVNGAALTGSADGAVISGGKAASANIWFNVVRGGVTFSCKGTISGNTLTLAETRADGSGLRNLIFIHN
jgi:hypothetical protein